MQLIYPFGIITVISLILYRGFRLKEKEFTHRFSILIELLLQIDKKLTIEYKDKDSATLSFFSPKGSLNIYCVQFRNIISIEVEIITAKNHIKDYEWHFYETVDQEQMFSEIISYLLIKHKGHFLDDRQLQKICKLHRSRKAGSTIFMKEHLSDAVFCQAFKAVKLFDREELIHFSTRFEMLFFNTVLLYSLLGEKGYTSILVKEDIICLLIFYLENHSLLDKIENIEDFLEDRFSLYAEQASLLKTGTDYDFSLLYHLFFVKPLGASSKFKKRELSDSNFKKLMSNMIRYVNEYALNYKELKTAC